MSAGIPVGRMTPRQLQIDLTKEKATGGRPFNAAPAVCKPVPAAKSGRGGSCCGSSASAASDVVEEHDDDYDDADLEVGIDAAERALHDYSMFEGRSSSGRSSAVFLPEFDDMMAHNWTYEKEYKHTYEEECRLAPDDPHNIKIVDYPCVIARGTPPRGYTCWKCGANTAHDVQTPQEVYATAYCVAGPVEAIRALRAFADTLVERKYDEAIKRTAVCRNVRCMIAQHKLAAESYYYWFFSGRKTGGLPRNQLERGTDRKDQGVVFADNVLLMRWAFMQQPPILDEEQITALFHWLVVNSQFVQEREKRFIATAIAVAESGTFPFKFTPAQKQSLVDRMSSIPRNYVHQIILPHIFDLTFDKERWQSMGNRHLETACPKAVDALYFLTCLTNWDNQQRPRDADGRPEHRIPKGNEALKELFTVQGFQKAVTLAVEEHGEEGYHLEYASAPPTKSSVKMSKRQSPIDTHKLLTLLTGSNKRCYTIANPVKANKNKKPPYELIGAAPTCGSIQADSGVHTKQRYDGVAEGLLMTPEEKEDAVSLFVDVWKAGNPVGKEKLQSKKADPTKSKACAALRPVKEHVDRNLESVNAAKRAKHAEAAAQPMMSLGKTKHGRVGLLAAAKRPPSTSSSS